MITIIEKTMKDLKISSYAVYGKDKYFQINIEAGQCINIDTLRQSIFNYGDKFIEIDVSCVHSDLYGYCLMIELYW